MSNTNGKAPSEADILRGQLAGMTKQVQQLTTALINAERSRELSARQASVANNALATVLHSQGLDGVKMTIPEQEAATEFCWLRVHLDIVEEDDKTQVMQLRLLAVTDEERAAAEAAMKKAEKDAKREAKRGPRLLGPDGQRL
jgi:hypothetical protein